jgi:FtsP/CotA-like multicopper oxidase with cupredoxin domain
VPKTPCFQSGIAFLLFWTLSALAQSPEPIVANQNRSPAGKLESGVLNIQLEVREGVWHPENEDGPALFVQAFGEAGQPAQIPGPMLRMLEGTTVHVTVANKLDTAVTVHGLNTRPGDSKDVLDIPAGETRERTFPAGAPGTYYYWARSTEPRKSGLGSTPQTVFEDAQLNGAFIIDPPGAVPPDRVFVVNLMFVEHDISHPRFEVVSINGKSYPFTEPLDYTVGDSIRWRVINPGFAPHPMHLHGAFYKVLSLGDTQTDMRFDGDDRQSVVTEGIQPGGTMMMEWSPEHAGRWLFHCHFQLHMSSAERVPVFTQPSEHKDPLEGTSGSMVHDGNKMEGMSDMAGLVLIINVRPSAGAAAPVSAKAATRTLDLIIDPDAQAAANEPKFSCAIREKNKLIASQDRGVGPPIVITRGQLTEITVLNHLKSPTTIHWHGLELESYYDGVVGGGLGDQVTSAIAPGDKFVARFTPSRAGTFIYHTHAGDPSQLTGGIYGALVVLEPGETFDPDYDKLLVIGTRDQLFNAKRITINGSEAPQPLTLARGNTYRLRLINIAPNLIGKFRLGTQEHPETWRELAKDGAYVPARLAKPGDAMLDILSGETYDFQFRADEPGDIPMEIQNLVSQAKLVTHVVVR